MKEADLDGRSDGGLKKELITGRQSKDQSTMHLEWFWSFKVIAHVLYSLFGKVRRWEAAIQSVSVYRQTPKAATSHK